MYIKRQCFSFDYRQWLNVFAADRHLDTKSLEKLRVAMTNHLAERRLPEEVDLPHVLHRINLREVLHTRILVHGVCPSAEMVLLYTTRANGIVHS